MAISSYPRILPQGSKGTTIPPNGNSLMLLNPSTGLYEPATSSTFAGGGGGGGGDATAANQVDQISLAIILNTLLQYGGQSNAQILNAILKILSGGTNADLLAILKQINGGTSGSYLYKGGDSAATRLNLLKVVVNADAVFNRLKDNTGTDLLALYGYTSQTLKQGAVIVPSSSGTWIAEIGLTSGSVLGYGS